MEHITTDQNNKMRLVLQTVLRCTFTVVMYYVPKVCNSFMAIFFNHVADVFKIVLV